MSDFDLSGAQKAGYSDSVIADHLAAQNNFDIKGARAAGYSDAEILSHLAPAPQEGGGVTDAGPATAQAPLRGDVIAPGNMPKDEFAGNVVTRLRNVATNALGAPRAAANLNKDIVDGLGLPKWAATGLNQLNPMSLAGQFLPSAAGMNKAIEDKTGIQPVATPGAAGPAIDAGVETAIGSLAGGPRALIPGFMGGAASQVAGDIPGVKGTPYEFPARLGGALFGSLAPSGLQRGVEAAAHSTPMNRAASVLSRNLDRDNMTFGELQGGQLPGAPLVTNAGENVTGALRGATAAPGPARTLVNEAFDKYLEGSEGRVGTGISRNVSDLPPMSTRINTLEKEQSAASRPAYQAAGVPARPEMTETTRPGEPVIVPPPRGGPLTATAIRAEKPTLSRITQAIQDADLVPGSIGAGKNQPETLASWLGGGAPKMPTLRAGEPITERAFNTPIVSTPGLEKLYRESPYIRSAIAGVRALPDYKNLPYNSMSMWDKAYKRLNDMEQSAIRAGKGSRANDIKNLRQDFKTALTDANPEYGSALKAYSEPQKLIEAAETGRDWFAKNRPNDEVAREYGALPPDQRREALGGIADYLRTKMGNTDRTSAGERLLTSENERGRLKAVLPPEDYAKFNVLIEQEKAVAAKAREVTKGSRTNPMTNEQLDNAAHNSGALLGILHKVSTGNYGLAALDMVKSAAAPIAKRMVGKSNEATNAALANVLTETDPQKIGLVRSLAEQASARRLSQQRGLTFGTLAPTVGATTR